MSKSPLIGTWATPAKAGAVATKTIWRDEHGVEHEQSYKGGAFWFYEPFNYPDLEAMAGACVQKIRDQRVMMLIGTPRAELDLTRPHRRLWKDAPDCPRTIDGGMRAWFPIDCDKAKIPAELSGPKHWVSAVEWTVENRLPEEMRDADILVMPSTSTGRRDGVVSFRGVVALKTPADLQVMHGWAVGAQRAGYAIDPAILTPNQPIYFSRAQFINMPDPLAAHGDLVFISTGSKRRAQIDFSKYDRANMEFVRRAASEYQALTGDWADKLAATLGGTSGFNTPIKRACAEAVRDGVSEDDWIAVALPVVDAALGRLSRDDAHDRAGKYDAPELVRLYRNLSISNAHTRAEITALRRGLGL